MIENKNLRDIPYLIDTTTVVAIYGDINEDSRDKVIKMKNPLHSGKQGCSGRLRDASKTFREFLKKNVSADQLNHMKPNDTINIVEIIGFIYNDCDDHLSVRCEFAEDCSDESLIAVRNHELEANHYDECAIMFHRISIPDELYPTEE